MIAKPNALSLFSHCTAAVLLSIGLAVPSQARPNSSIKAFNEGVRLFNENQYNAAVSHFDEAISGDSDFTEAYYARGACKYYLKSLDGALSDLNAALRLKPDYTDARALRGAVSYDMDNWEAALDDFNKVLAVHPQDAQSLLGRAVILLKREDLAGAQRDFKAFLRVRPDDPMSPKIREVLASLSHSGTTGASEEETPTPRSPRDSSEARSPRSTTPRASRALSSEELQKLADGLFSHSLSASYGRKVMRGEKAQAVGDIHSSRSVPNAPPSSSQDIEIVEPQ